MGGDQEAGAFGPRRSSPIYQALGGKGGERDLHEYCGRDRDGGYGAMVENWWPGRSAEGEEKPIPSWVQHG